MSYAQEQRKKIINKIIATLKLVKEQNKELDDSALIVEIMTMHGATMKKAKQYIMEARFIMGNKNGNS